MVIRIILRSDDIDFFLYRKFPSLYNDPRGSYRIHNLSVWNEHHFNNHQIDIYMLYGNVDSGVEMFDLEANIDRKLFFLSHLSGETNKPPSWAYIACKII